MILKSTSSPLCSSNDFLATAWNRWAHLSLCGPGNCGVAEKPGFSHAFTFAFSASRPLIQLAGSQCPGHSSCWVVLADSPQNEEVEWHAISHCSWEAAPPRTRVFTSGAALKCVPWKLTVCQAGCPSSLAKAEKDKITAFKGLLGVRHCLRQFIYILFNPFTNSEALSYFKDEESGFSLIMDILGFP